MKKVQKILMATLTCAAIAVSSVAAFAAAGYQSQAEIVADLTGKTVQEVIKQRTDNKKTYGQIAYEAGKSTEFIEASTQLRIDALKAQVASGKITQTQADAAVDRIKANQANCTGTGSGNAACAGLGLGIGGGSGAGKGAGGGNGGGCGRR